jgi:hypothetical protein
MQPGGEHITDEHFNIENNEDACEDLNEMTDVIDGYLDKMNIQARLNKSRNVSCLYLQYNTTG